MKQPKAGFTLVEMMVVLVVIGMTLGISAVSLLMIGKASKDTENDGKIAEARSRALTTGEFAMGIIQGQEFLFAPDGSAVPVNAHHSDPSMTLDPWTGIVLGRYRR